jgi:hypothetical protein
VGSEVVAHERWQNHLAAPARFGRDKVKLATHLRERLDDLEARSE